MKKLILAFSILAISGTAFAGTWDISGTGDCSDWSNAQAQNDYICWSIGQIVTHNDTAQANSNLYMTITRTGTLYANPANPTHYDWNCTGSGCDYMVYTFATINGNVGSFAEASNASTSVNVGNVTGPQSISYTVSERAFLCHPPAGWNCITTDDTSMSTPINIQSASVQLNITGFIDKLLNMFD